eukprot:1928567-Lingulodinium_polyedra.AAC.1
MVEQTHDEKAGPRGAGAGQSDPRNPDRDARPTPATAPKLSLGMGCVPRQGHNVPSCRPVPDQRRDGQKNGLAPRTAGSMSWR